MSETFVERGDLSMSGLAASLTAREQGYLLRISGLTMDLENEKNIATYEEEQESLTALTICAAEGYGVGRKILTTTALIRRVPTEISIYRLPKE